MFSRRTDSTTLGTPPLTEELLKQPCTQAHLVDPRLAKDSTATLAVPESVVSAVEAVDGEVADDEDVMPEASVVDAWFDEIMANLLPSTTGRTRQPLAAAQLNLGLEAKWDLVKTYRDRSEQFSKYAISTAARLDNRQAINLHLRRRGQPPLRPPLRSYLPHRMVEGVGQDMCMTMKLSIPLDFIMVFAVYVPEGAQLDTSDKFLLEVMQELRVCLACEHVGWTAGFLQYHGLDYVSRILEFIAFKPSKTNDDWTLQLEVLRTLRTLCETFPAYAYLCDTPKVMIDLCRTIFGFWQEHHDHSDHLERCVFRSTTGPTTRGDGNDPPASSDKSSSRKHKHSTASRIAEPSLYTATSTRPPLALRRVGMEVLTIIIEKGGWKLAMMGMDVVAGSNSRFLHFAWDDFDDFTPCLGTFLPFAHMTLRAAAASSRRWAGLEERAHQLFVTLSNTVVRTRGYRSTPKVVPMLPEEDENEEADVLRYLREAMRLALALVHPGVVGLEDQFTHARELLDRAGIKVAAQKLREAPDPTLVELAERYLSGNGPNAETESSSSSPPLTPPTTTTTSRPSAPPIPSRRDFSFNRSRQIAIRALFAARTHRTPRPAVPLGMRADTGRSRAIRRRVNAFGLMRGRRESGAQVSPAAPRRSVQAIGAAAAAAAAAAAVAPMDSHPSAARGLHRVRNLTPPPQRAAIVRRRNSNAMYTGYGPPRRVQHLTQHSPPNSSELGIRRCRRARGPIPPLLDGESPEPSAVASPPAVTRTPPSPAITQASTVTEALEADGDDETPMYILLQRIMDSRRIQLEIQQHREQQEQREAANQSAAERRRQGTVFNTVIAAAAEDDCTAITPLSPEAATLRDARTYYPFPISRPEPVPSVTQQVDTLSLGLERIHLGGSPSAAESGAQQTHYYAEDSDSDDSSSEWDFARTEAAMADVFNDF
ncbi:hypothetical protein DFS34DRAFT_644961 [Phlyctochytrium arcticum]|nr:hypothetical protein DFS34DRAFT_644961 [Phlyctochytrium arcticum]